MLKTAGKRLIILLPAVWLLASAVFLLSKTIPGSATHLQFEQAAENANSSAKAEARQRAYRQMLHRTGEDLPLFYFGMGTAAEPDSLYRIFPVNERLMLKKWVLRYGDWPEIAAFYLSWQRFVKNVAASGVAPEFRREILRQSARLLKDPAPEKTENHVLNLQKTVCRSGQKVLCEQVGDLQFRLRRVQAAARPARNYRPAFFWYGLQNQYHRWFRNLLRGELGYSSRDMRPVTAVISEAFGNTLVLAVTAFLLIAISGPVIALGLCLHKARKIRGIMLGFLYGLESIPLFIVALFFLAVAGFLGWFYAFPEETGMLLAVLVLVLVRLPYLTGQTVTALQRELQQQYVVTAKAKGLSEKRILLRHVFRNSLLPVITLLADLFPVLLAGAVIVEVIFSLPGLGRLLVNAVLARDYEVVAGLVLLTGMVKMLAHLLADIFYKVADPRLGA